MKISSVDCPSCQQNFQVAQDNGEKTVPCPSCNANVTLALSSDPEPGLRRVDMDSEAVNTAKALRQSAADLRSMATASIVVGVVIGAFVLFSSPNSGFSIAAGIVVFGCFAASALRFFARLADIQAEICRTRAAIENAAR